MAAESFELEASNSKTASLASQQLPGRPSARRIGVGLAAGSLALLGCALLFRAHDGALPWGSSAAFLIPGMPVSLPRSAVSPPSAVEHRGGARPWIPATYGGPDAGKRTSRSRPLALRAQADNGDRVGSAATGGRIGSAAQGGRIGSAAIGAVAAVVEEVSRSTDSYVEAPETQRTFVSMDSTRQSVLDEDGLPLVYNKDGIQAYWEKQGGALQQRWVEFLGVSIPFITRVAGLLIQGGSEALAREAASLARDARVNVEKLGPTYVKLGQTLSVRPDVLPAEALKELSVLQDNVKGFPNEMAFAVIEQEYGVPLTEVFSEISDDPVAAASLAQVYKAKLRSTGEEVAVKVQRPGVRALISKDLYVLRRAAEVYQGLITRFAPQQRTDYIALLNEWAIGFYTELDFTNEGKNMAKMRRLLDEQNVKGVLVPRVIEEHTTNRILVTDWVDGVKLSECSPDDLKELVDIGQEVFLVQLLQLGFFHADPHPGNLLRLNDQSEYKLALIDFGLIAQIEQSDIDAIVSAIIHLANKDYPALVEDFITLKILPEDCNRVKVIPLMDKALTPYVKGGGAKVYEAEVRKTYGVDKDAGGAFAAMTGDVLTVLNDIPFSIPPYFALLARAIVTLEGVALTADKNYGLIIEAYPFVARKLLAEGRSETQQVLQEVLYGSGAGDGRGLITPARLAALLNSAAGIVAKEEGSVFVNIEKIPEDGISIAQAAKYILSDDAGSVRTLLKDESIVVVDLLLRQALRRGIPALAASLPSPPEVPFLPPPVSPMDVPGPFLLPAIGDQSARPILVSPQKLLDEVAPKLTREEELYALSIVDLVRSSLGDDAAAVLSGESITNPLTTLRLLLTALAAAEPSGDSPAHTADGRRRLPPQVYAAAERFRDIIKTDQSMPSGSAVESASDDQVAELTAALANLDDKEGVTFRDTTDEVTRMVLTRLGERVRNLA